MENYNIYEDIAQRTQGALYIGVVGPVRTGKSTFIKRFLEQLVIPRAEEGKRSQMQDELPQSSGGKTVMTTEPKFVPAQPADIRIGENTAAQVRLIDCVGYVVDGAAGVEEDGAERMINTPWQEEALPFSKAAAMGTEKVIREHSTVAVLVTTDGSVTDIPRENYIRAEEQTVNELKSLQKPFVILLNCREPQSESAQSLRAALEEKYAAQTVAVNVESMNEEGLLQVLERLLFEFPVAGIDINIPEWMRSLPAENSLIGEIAERLRAVAPRIEKMKDCALLEEAFTGSEKLAGVESFGLDLSQGTATCSLTAKENVYYSVISEECGEKIENDFDLLRYVQTLSGSKREYDRIGAAFRSAREVGYGVVSPDTDDIALGAPSISRQGQNVGLHLTAAAPAYHIFKVDVTSSVDPMVGSQKQSEDFVKSLLADYEEDEEKLWNTELFGKTLRSLVNDGLDKKSGGMNEVLQKKLRRALQRIVNDGRGNILCILL